MSHSFSTEFFQKRKFDGASTARYLRAAADDLRIASAMKTGKKAPEWLQDTQEALLLKGDEKLPSAQVMAYSLIDYYLATGKRLVKNGAARCSDVTHQGELVYISNYNEKELGFFSLPPIHQCADHFGLGSEKKPE